MHQVMIDEVRKRTGGFVRRERDAICNCQTLDFRHFHLAWPGCPSFTEGNFSCNLHGAFNRGTYLLFIGSWRWLATTCKRKKKNNFEDNMVPPPQFPFESTAAEQLGVTFTTGRSIRTEVWSSHNNPKRSSRDAYCLNSTFIWDGWQPSSHQIWVNRRGNRCCDCIKSNKGVQNCCLPCAFGFLFNAWELLKNVLSKVTPFKALA